jgi:DNA-binding response OmpR family regulator
MVGRDRVLLETRGQVLRAAGYIVVSSSYPEQAVSQFRMSDFDIVLLCHSIPPNDRESLSRQIREHTARTSVVSVAAYLGQLDTFSDATIPSDPEELIKGMNELIRRDGSRPSDGMGKSDGVSKSDGAGKSNGQPTRAQMKQTVLYVEDEPHNIGFMGRND